MSKDEIQLIEEEFNLNNKTMSKPTLDGMPDDYCLAAIARYHKNKIKNGRDPFLTTKAIKIRFIITPEKSEKLLKFLIARNNRQSPYIVLNFI